ncbi:uncharacterized protein LOC143981627 isoform X2 [Lithobates pipiens]
MMSPVTSVYGGLLYMMIISVSSGTVYIQSGSDITGCNMKCPEDDDEVTMELYRVCRGKERTLLENHCYYNHTKSHDSRLRLHTGSGCWKLTHAKKDDSGVYKIWCYCDPGYVMSSTEIRVLDPVLISNISSNFSQLGEEVAVRVQFSGEESTVTWEVDGKPLPERYRLIDDNRTLIIPSVQRGDAERRFRVRITNPVSEEIREYRLEIGDYRRSRMFLIPVVLVMIIGILVSLIYYRKRDLKSNGVYEDEPLAENGSVPPIQNGSIHTNGVYIEVPVVEDRSVPPIQNGSLSTNSIYEDLPLAKDGSVSPIQNGFTLTIGVPQDVPLAENRSVPPIQNGSIPTNKIGFPPATKNTFLSIERIETPYPHVGKLSI